MASGMGESASGPGTTPTPWPDAQAQETDGSYDVTREDPPSHDVSKPAISHALEVAEETRNKIRQLFLAVRQKCTDTSGLEELETSFLQQMPIVQRRLAVIGDSGQGKSSLMNSLLHIPDIAHTGDSGSACTSVVIEYHQKKSDQTSPILITVEFYAGTALEDMVTSMLHSCQSYWMEKSQEERDEQNTGNESITQVSRQDSNLEEMKKEAIVAETGLQAAFKHHAGWSLEFIRDFSAEEQVRKQLIEWAHAIEWPRGDTTTTQEGSKIWKCSAEDADECAETTGRFMEDKLWPFTKVIKVYLHSPILTSGLILADLPGLHDTNRARVRASEAYIRECEQALIVHNIRRVVTDESVKTYLTDEARRLKAGEFPGAGGTPLSLTVVCTGADVINERGAIRSFVGDGKRISKNEMKQLQDNVNHAKKYGNSEQKEAAEERLKATLKAARNEHISKEVKEAYEGETGLPIDVFCVGNLAYEKLCETGDANLVQTTGIPALRRYCHSITADARLENARHWIKTVMPSLLQSADMWAHSKLSSISLGELQRERIMTALGKVQRKTPAKIAELLRALLQGFWEEFMATWIEKQDQWSQAAIRESRGWTHWHWTSYNIFLWRLGKHRTRAVGYHNWNHSMTLEMQNDLSKPWEVLLSKVSNMRFELEEKLNDQLSQFVDESLADVPIVERNMLITTVQHITQQWQYLMRNVIGVLTKSVTNMRVQTVKVDYSSYIVFEMRPTYRSAYCERGIGMAKRQRERVAAKLENGTLFPNMAATMSRDMEGYEEKSADAVRLLGSHLMDSLAREFRVVLNPKKRDASAETPVLELKEAVREASERLARLDAF